ncbi:MAG TPA: hypothetical protein VG295_06015 [Solirubrobacteraceae bacterium]|nr:hypothetical protein [Solirubrobacteraceae bacterium]
MRLARDVAMLVIACALIVVSFGEPTPVLDLGIGVTALTAVVLMAISEAGERKAIGGRGEAPRGNDVDRPRSLPGA